MFTQTVARNVSPAGQHPGTVLERLDEWVARTPDADAVRCAGTVLTYAELHRESARLAWALFDAGVGPGSVVGVVMDRSAYLPAVLLSVLRAGAGYLPVDPEYPDAAIAASFSVAGVRVAVADARYAKRAGGLATGLRVLTPYPTDHGAVSTEPPPVEVGPDSLQYVIHTSGSTDRPKAIAMMHGPQSRLVEWSRERYCERVSALQYFPVTTDVASLEIFGTWGTGGCLVVATDAERHDVAALARLVENESIRRVLLPVAVLQRLAEHCAPDFAQLGSLVELVTTGERLTTTPAIRALASSLGPDALLDDHYGSSEVNVVVAPRLGQPAEEWPDLPLLGPPIVDARIYVLAADLGPVPRNVVGEIYVGGGPLARGYLGQGGLTAASFLPDPFSPVRGARMYKTGDLGRWRSGGRLEFMGRNDYQIKVRGYRVEPFDVESVLQALPEVDRAVVMLIEVGPDGREALTAYVSATDGARVEPEKLRKTAAAALPSQMVPETVVVLDQIPLLATGKVDRSRLQAPDMSGMPEVAPRDDVEQAIAEVWCDVLNRESVGVADNFFALGGHSLLVTRVVYELRDVFDIDLPLVTVFQMPTVEGLASQVRELLEEDR